MQRFVMTVLFALICLVVGFCLGIWFGPQLSATSPAQWIAANVPGATSLMKPDQNSPFESYAYPTIKWRPKLLVGAPGALAQLSTTYEYGSDKSQPGVLKYKLTMFKAPEKQQCEIQLLDDMGFKLIQFNASSFHEIPGAPDIVEARDNITCSEEDYKRAKDYSVN